MLCCAPAGRHSTSYAAAGLAGSVDDDATQTPPPTPPSPSPPASDRCSSATATSMADVEQPALPAKATEGVQVRRIGEFDAGEQLSADKQRSGTADAAAAKTADALIVHTSTAECEPTAAASVAVDPTVLSTALAMHQTATREMLRQEMLVAAREESASLREALMQQQMDMRDDWQAEALREAQAAFEQRLVEEAAKVALLTEKLESFTAAALQAPPPLPTGGFVLPLLPPPSGLSPPLLAGAPRTLTCQLRELAAQLWELGLAVVCLRTPQVDALPPPPPPPRSLTVPPLYVYPRHCTPPAIHTRSRPTRAAS